MAGKRLRRAGLMRMVGETSGDGRGVAWRAGAVSRYHFGEGEEHSVNGGEDAAAALLRGGVSPDKNKRKRGLTAQAVEKVERQGGELVLAILLRIRVRYFTQSAAFGSREFVEGMFARNREKIHVKREGGEREPKEAALRGQA